LQHESASDERSNDVSENDFRERLIRDINEPGLGTKNYRDGNERGQLRSFDGGSSLRSPRPNSLPRHFDAGGEIASSSNVAHQASGNGIWLTVIEFFAELFVRASAMIVIPAARVPVLPAH
jgi:hypothetical protein